MGRKRESKLIVCLKYNGTERRKSVNEVNLENMNESKYGLIKKWKVRKEKLENLRGVM